MTPSRWARALPWLRDHPLAFDALIATAAFCVTICVSVTVSHPPDGGSGFGERDLPAHTVALTALACAVLVLRRRFPMQVLVAAGLVALVEMALGHVSHQPADRHASIVITVVVALFTVAAGTDRSTTWWVGWTSAAVFMPATMLLSTQPWYGPENLGVFAWIALATVSGEVVRSRRAVVDAIRERAERAERTREEEALRRVADERMRIARELHDVVAHHIALVNVQAGVASHVMDTRPDQAKEALAHIREASRHALGELQTTVGLLRQEDEPVAPTEPTRGLEVLDELVEGFTRAGMSVTVEAPAAGGPLPSAVDLAAYRVVQEALTNVHKHAGVGAAARVRIVRRGSVADAALDITVDDDGDGAGDRGGEGQAAGSGHGLTGMRERATALGGTCEAGPTPGGGFRVRVSLPLQAQRPAEVVETARSRRRALGGRCA
ncbi:sensor histidine kinase [Streptomyces sp. SBT349]|uniref:sensor histidine kinase n=1 Tax=Streptomyces sp. SBT349 TaxID=1580539 RepID=UPI0007C77595|nr:histidine kinase [Streptomyces sp. SBT349]